MKEIFIIEKLDFVGASFIGNKILNDVFLSEVECMKYIHELGFKKENEVIIKYEENNKSLIRIYRRNLVD